MLRIAASEASRDDETGSEGEAWEEAVAEERSGSAEVSVGAITEASNLTRLDESFDDAVELRFEDRSKNTGRKVSVSCKIWSWFSFELFSWEFMVVAGANMGANYE